MRASSISVVFNLESAALSRFSKRWMDQCLLNGRESGTQPNNWLAYRNIRQKRMPHMRSAIHSGGLRVVAALLAVIPNSFALGRGGTHNG